MTSNEPNAIPPQPPPSSSSSYSSSSSHSINNNSQYEEYKYYNSSSLALELSMNIIRLELPIDMNITSSDVPVDIYITGYIISNSIIMHESCISTLFGDIDRNINSYSWNYILSFPLRIRDLSLDSRVMLTVWTSDGRMFGKTSMRLFNDKEVLKQGKQKLIFYFNNNDSNSYGSDDGKGDDDCKGEIYNSFYEKYDYQFQVEKTLELFNKNQNNMNNRKQIINKCEWLDNFSLSYLTSAYVTSSVKNNYQYPLTPSSSSSSSSASSTYNDNSNNVISIRYDNDVYNSSNGVEISSNSMNDIELNNINALSLIDKPRNYDTIINDLESNCYLIVELPMLQYPVLYDEKPYQQGRTSMTHPYLPPNKSIDFLKSFIVDQSDTVIEFSLVGRPFNPVVLNVCADLDMETG